MPVVKAWSYSAWSLHDQCPHKYKLQNIDKIKESPMPEALRNGIEKHKVFENYVKDGFIESLMPEAGKLLIPLFNEIKEFDVTAEKELCFNDQWQKTGWFSKDAWLRIKIDLEIFHKPSNTIMIVDHKTGKMRDGYETQLQLFALGAMLDNPGIERVITELWYCEHQDPADPTRATVVGGKNDPSAVFTRDQLPGLQKVWLNKINRMFNDVDFRPTKNYLCDKWCWYGAQPGLCEFGPG